jgi:beta-mannosidase
LLKVGGFRCVDLKSLGNDNSYDLYEVGYFTYASFRMEVWKRHGVPFWYPRHTGNIRVAGARWKPATIPIVSAALAGAVAHADSQQPGNGAVSNANDGQESTYWFAGENQPHGRLWIDFKATCRVSNIRFLGWATPRHAPKDYSVGVLLPDGARKEIASISDENRMGQWISFPVPDLEAKGVYLEVRSTMEGRHGPVIYELEALGQCATAGARPAEVVIPLKGTPAEEVFFLGNVGDGFETAPDVETPVGEYVLRYVDGREEVVPLVAGRNVAPCRYGHFVPQAEFAFGFNDALARYTDAPGTLYYHLDEMLPVDPRRQLMMFRHAPKFAGLGLESVKFRCTNPESSLVLAGLTLRESGPRMNALAYNGRTVRPYPAGTPKAKLSPVDAMVDKTGLLSLDGEWQFATDPGNLGTKRGWYAPGFDAASWKKMLVPSQWYVQGVDYHGAAWFRRGFEVPQSFPGSVLELRFGGVDYDARVWVNGEYVGRHLGAFSSFKLDATKALRKGSRNLIAVRVDSPIDPGYSPQKTVVKGNSQDDIAMPYNEEGCSGGIYRSVTLAGRGDVGLENVWASSAVRSDLKHADATIHLEAHPAQPATAAVTVHCRLSEPKTRGRTARVFSAEKQLSLNEVAPVKFEFGIDEPRLWFPWEQGPQSLYTLEVEVRRGGELLDRHVSRIGLRQVDLNREEKCVYVNHHRIFIKGMLNDDSHWMSLMDRTGYRQRIQLQKDANLNLVRMIGHESSPDMYDLCDEMGLMIWQEMPLQWGYSSAEQVRKDILEVVGDTVRQCRPHASVIGWSAWNEGGQPGFSERVTQTITRLDETRPISHASGYGDFDIHIYPNITPAQLSRRTFFWTGLKLGFVSEVGAYGLSSLEELKEITGGELFPFDSADYFWETFNSYRYNDGPVFWDAPSAADWPTEKIRKYVLGKIGPSERWLEQFMKFMYENLRAQRFNPTTAAIHCRFDDPLPTAYLGVVNFNGRPRQAYYSVRQACQPVLPMLFFDFQGAEDVRVINEYWNHSWPGCTLEYQLADRSGKTITRLERRFDLPADATVSVLKREEIGDLFHIPGGFFARLTVLDKRGKALSKNTYDLTGDEIEAFVTSVYPVPPVTPLNSMVVTAAQLAAASGAGQKVEASDTYSPLLLRLGDGGRQELRFNVDLPQDGPCLIRAACDSGANLRRYALLIDGGRADLEHYPFTDMSLGATRLPYSAHHLSWYPGWSAKLTKGAHEFELRWPDRQPAASVLIDAISLQHCLNPNTTGYRPDDHPGQTIRFLRRHSSR